MVYAVVVAFAWLASHSVYRLQVTGMENLPRQGGYIIAPNHISAMDPVFIAVARIRWPRMLIIGKEELFRNPALAWLLKHLGVVPIARGKADMGTLEKAVESCRGGKPLLIFPEGTRSKKGEPGVIKSGAFAIAGQAGVGIVPCRVIYSTKTGFQHPFCRVRVCFGPLIPAETYDMGEKRNASQLRACRSQLAEQWQKLYDENRFYADHTF